MPNRQRWTVKKVDSTITIHSRLKIERSTVINIMIMYIMKVPNRSPFLTVYMKAFDCVEDGLKTFIYSQERWTPRNE